VLVRVAPQFLPDQSDPDRSRYAWAYTVDIENRGAEAVTLVSRHWEITDGLGRMQVVDGPGVVGEQPTLNAGESFRYTSGCPLATPSGMMNGTYQMVTEGGERFDAAIPAFSLHLPQAARRLN